MPCWAVRVVRQILRKPDCGTWSRKATCADRTDGGFMWVHSFSWDRFIYIILHPHNLSNTLLYCKWADALVLPTPRKDVWQGSAGRARSSFESIYRRRLRRPTSPLRSLQQSCSPWQRAEAAAKLGSESSKLQRCSAGKALTGEATANVAQLAKEGHGFGWGFQGTKTCHAAISKAYVEAVCRAYVTARAGFGARSRTTASTIEIEAVCTANAATHGCFWRRDVAAWVCFGGACRGWPRPRLRSLRKLQRKALGF